MKTLTKDETLVRDLVEKNAASIAARDLDTHMLDYTDDLLMFDAIPPLAFRGADKLRAGWQMCLDHTDGPFEYRHENLEVTVAGDLALVSSLVSFKARSKARDVEIVSVMRNTMGLRKIDGAWKIFHAHGSAPFDPMSEKALLREELKIS